jgi:tetratricopeptide (TPR) repeat protein
LANVYNHTGLLEQGQQQIETAVSLDPTSAGRRFRVGINLLYQGRWEDALLWMRSGKEFFPSLWAYQSAFALVQLARPDEARELIRNAVRQDTPEAAGLLEAMEALLAAEAGDVKKADDRIRAAIQRGEQFQHFHHVAYGIASSYALMNRREQALRWLRRAADDGFPCYPLFLNDHNLDNLRQDSQFVRFMAELDQQWKHYAALP